MKTRLIIFFMMLMGAMSVQKADACSRVVYTGDTISTPETLRIVGRSLDWSTPIPTNLFVYPRGMKKQSNASGDMITWTSKYGAVYAAGYNAGVTEGMNEKGLVINGLFCRGTVYNSPAQEDKPAMSLAVIVAWLLDNNATTQEVVEVVKNQNFKIVGATFDGGTVSTLHWGVTDATGATAILEFQNGKLDIYEGDYPVLTNDPPFEQMLAINKYWEGVGGQNFLPGTVKSPDRFARASFFNSHVDKTNDLNEGLAIIRSILNNVSVPFKYNLGDKNLSSTQWRSFANLRDKTYYFENVTDLGIYYIDLKKCDLRPGASVMYLDTQKATEYVGDVTSKLVKSKPFTPMY